MVDPDSQDEIKDNLDARYLSAAWRIFGFQINHREPVSPLPVHLLGHDQVISEEGSKQVALQTTVSMLDCYLSKPNDTIFDDIKYCEYEQYMVSNTLARPQRHRETRYWTIKCRD